MCLLKFGRFLISSLSTLKNEKKKIKYQKQSLSQFEREKDTHHNNNNLKDDFF